MATTSSTMTDATSIFVTVTTTATGTPAPTLSATQVNQIDKAKRTGDIVAFAAIGSFLLLAVVLSTCWCIVRARRPRPQPLGDDPDAVGQERHAFLPNIGSWSRKSTASVETRSLSNVESRRSLAGTVSTTTPRLSMWADEVTAYRQSTPSPPSFASHSRSSSTASTARIGLPHELPRSLTHSTSALTLSHPHHAFALQHYNASSMSISRHTPSPPPPLPPKVGHVDGALGVQVGRPSFEQRQQVSPLVSPEEPMSYQLSSHSSGSFGRTPNRVLYG